MTGVVCVVQARMGSTRLPGKVVADLGGRPLLEFLLGRLTGLPVDEVVVATSSLPRDDTVAQVAAAAGAGVVRGSEEDVLSRHLAVVDRYRPDHVIRVTADCPLADPELIRAVLDLHLAAGADYTSNVLPRTYPKGLDVEVATADALRTAGAEARERAEREHVMPFLYRRPERFTLANLRGPADLGGERWTVDTPDDLARVRGIVERLAGDDRAGWQRMLELVGTQWRRPPGVGLRLATEDDEAYLLELRNDDLTVRNSTSRQAVDPSAHGPWFRARLADPGCRMWVGTDDGVDVGSLRLDVRAAVGTVSIAVDPAHRGRGVGRRLLDCLNEEMRGDPQVVELRALVSPANPSSQRIFEHAGYRRTGVAGSDLLYSRSTTGSILHSTDSGATTEPVRHRTEPG